MNMSRYYSEIPSPVGPVTIVSDGTHITAVTLLGANDVVRDATWRESDALLADARAQLLAYFAGELREFTLPLAPHGTPFQRTVWSALERIPFGETTSYGAIAAAIGRPDASRAVGAANGPNPIAIVVPCHRVIGRDGTLTGYAGGLERKSWLLTHEAQLCNRTEQLQLGIPANS
jgi:methylated-DNA-[protein]-cysteine S-methyltransferase